MSNSDLLRRINNAEQGIPLRMYLEVLCKTTFVRHIFCFDTGCHADQPGVRPDEDRKCSYLSRSSTGTLPRLPIPQ